MPTVHLEANLSPDALLDAARQLSGAELSQFVDQLLLLKAQRTAPSLTEDEAALLLAINAGLPPETQARWDELLRLRDAEKLTEEEYAELLRLTEVVEQRQAERVGQLLRLAQLRGVSLQQLMAELGIPAQPHGR